MENIEIRVENALLKGALTIASKRLYNYGFCPSKYICKKRMQNCHECIKQFLIDKSYEEKVRKHEK